MLEPQKALGSFQPREGGVSSWHVAGSGDPERRAFRKRLTADCMGGLYPAVVTVHLKSAFDLDDSFRTEESEPDLGKGPHAGGVV